MKQNNSIWYDTIWSGTRLHFEHSYNIKATEEQKMTKTINACAQETDNFQDAHWALKTDNGNFICF